MSVKIPPEHLIKLEDGYWYYDPPKQVGAMSPDTLREIADQIDDMNEEWDSRVNHEIWLKP